VGSPNAPRIEYDDALGLEDQGDHGTVTTEARREIFRNFLQAVKKRFDEKDHQRPQE
jgi:hypothetical protein